jgi:hypothetical protein
MWREVERGRVEEKEMCRFQLGRLVRVLVDNEELGGGGAG